MNKYETLFSTSMTLMAS